MQADFLDAHQRHWDDAEHLFQVGRWANADHLFGMAAECGLKRLMLAFGMICDPVTDRPQKIVDRKHANDIWDRFEAYRSGHHQGIGYGPIGENPFRNWDVSQRYAHHANFDQARAQDHQTGAKMVRALIVKARFEGLIT